jgi:hypothetical protein
MPPATLVVTAASGWAGRGRAVSFSALNHACAERLELEHLKRWTGISVHDRHGRAALAGSKVQPSGAHSEAGLERH